MLKAAMMTTLRPVLAVAMVNIRSMLYLWRSSVRMTDWKAAIHRLVRWYEPSENTFSISLY